MTVVSNDPSWWPTINSAIFLGYFVVASSTAVIYDWVLTFGQEVELVWRQRWSLMTVLYLSVRYLGILFSIISIPLYVPTILVTDVGCLVMYLILDWTVFVVTGILGVIVIVRLYAMFQRSIKVLIFLAAAFLALSIFNGVMTALSMRHISGEEFILSGTYQCAINFVRDHIILISMAWILATVWEVLVLCLSLWIAVKHFRELRQQSAGWIIGDCFTVLIKSHVAYFASFAAVSCFELAYLSPTFAANVYSLDAQVYTGVIQVLTLLQLFVLGPRLILGVREYHAKLVTDSDAATGMTSIAFQERVHVATSGSV